MECGELITVFSAHDGTLMAGNVTFSMNFLTSNECSSCLSFIYSMIANQLSLNYLLMMNDVHKIGSSDVNAGTCRHIHVFHYSYLKYFIAYFS